MTNLSKYFLAALLISTNAFATTKTLEIVVPYPPGGTADKVAQAILPALRTELTKENIVPVINYRPGAGSVTGIASVAKNDHLQLVITSNSVITAPILNKMPNSYSLAEDLEVVSYLGRLPSVLVTSTTSGIKNFADLEQQCRSNKFNYASGGPGSVSHLGSALLFDKLNCNPIHVPYKGGGPMVTAVLGNHNPVGADFFGGVKALIDDGKLVPLLVLDRHRIDSLPGVPSLTDIGITEYQLVNWFVIMSNRSGTPQQTSQLNKAVTNAVNSPEVLTQLKAMGLKDVGAKKSRDFLVEEQQTLIRILKTVKIND